MMKRLARFLILFHLFGKFAGFLFSPSKQMVVNRAKNLKAGEEKSEIEVPKAWIPLAIADTIEEKYPKRIDVLGESFVVWRDPKAFNSTNKGWTVMRDYCPHRFAPLSEGRIDEKTGCLECPYHGWQFRSETGECTRIPQALSDEKKMTCTTQTTAKTFPVHLTSQIIWAYLPVSGLNQSFPDFPENLFPEINDAQRLTMVRDVPYSFDFTVENFMDPAHIPFAHHRLQGSRDDAIGIPMEILTNIDNQTHCEVSFQDRTRKRKREGIVSFISPIFYSLKLLNQESNDYHRPLYMFVVPVETARTRIFVSTKIPMSLLFKLFPTWFLHAATMKFINSDIWVYDQEKMIRNPLNRFWKNKSGSKLYNDALLGNRHIRHPHGNLNEGEEILPKYTLVTQSDRGCIAWRKWWKKHM